ncbi:MAG TPA: cytochrome c/FTR1 family iron permease [Burkholderiales bacterium]|nr:cytochrome c/FTR1 family iron permease [Burkholderiales bacterium]
MWARLLLVALLCASLSARADNAAQAIVHMLDYVGVDYPEFVKDGKVLDADEYKEQQEFSVQVVELLGKLPVVPQRDALLKQANELKTQIDNKAPGADVARLASDLRWKMIAAYRITVTPRSAPDPKRGMALYAMHCAGCHGTEGRGDGPAAKGLNPSPSNFHDKDRMMQRSLYGLYSTITLGVSGTAMIAYAQLSEEERWALAFYVGALGTNTADARKGEQLWNAGRGKAEVGTLRTIATLTDKEVSDKHGADIAQVFAWLKANPRVLELEKESPIAFSRRLLTESVAAYRADKRSEAQQLALTAYLEGFELAEATLDTLDRNLRQEIETQMIAYRDLLRRAAPVEQIAKQAEHLDGLLAASAEKLDAEGLSPTTAAVSAFLILVREGLEALLVVAAIIAFLIKANRREALRWIHVGWVGALVLGMITWFAAAKLIVISGATRELTEGITALLAAVILLYVGFWLHGKSYARAWKVFIEQHLGAALQGGKLWALAGVSFLAVYREAFETVLFYQALWQQAGDRAHGSVVVGFLCGVAVLALLAWLILRYGLRLPIGPFFGACSVLMALLAIVFTGHGIKALQEAGLIAASPVDTFNLPALGIYATEQTLLAQAVAIAIVIAAFVWTRAASKRGIATT